MHGNTDGREAKEESPTPKYSELHETCSLYINKML